MHTRTKVSLLAVSFGLVVWGLVVWGLAVRLLPAVRAHNPGYSIPSPGKPPSHVVTLNGTEGVGEWAGAYAFNIDYGGGNPLIGHVKAMHKADGIYLLVDIEDAVSNNDDTLRVSFDIDHDGTAVTEATDWGVEIRRVGAANWGPANADPATWAAVPAGNFGSTTIATGWKVEFRLPAGADPANLNLSTGTVGVYFSIYDADNALGLPSAKYTQWPQPAVATPDDLLDGRPIDWGNYVFNPATTFPNLAITDVRRGDGAAEDYYKISHTANNRFDVRVNNPGGTAIADATGVRLNLYLAARGIGESWHRLDTDGTLDGDCASVAPLPPTSPIAKSDICSGVNSLDDIETQTLADIVGNTAMYNVKNGTSRLDGGAITVPGTTNDYYQVMNWNTTALQDARFTEVVVGAITYQRQHACMMAEAVVPNDPNNADNRRQVNMDFVCVPGAGLRRFDFSLGWAGFAKYDPNIGKEMFLQVDLKNASPRDGWNFRLEGVRQLGNNNTFAANLRGRQSLPVQLSINAPRPEQLGRTLKENLIIPPRAGGRQPNAIIPSGRPPVYVKVAAGSTVLIANYSFNDGDAQFVDLDGNRRLLAPNGPDGLPARYLQRLIRELGNRFRLLVAQRAPLGALVGSFDNFRTAFAIGAGAQVKVPAGATHLALAINDAIGFYNDNSGSGFRVKVIEQTTRVAALDGPAVLRASFTPQIQQPSRLQVIPLREVMPTFCISGYEDIGQTRKLNGKEHKLFRYIGNVCWGIVNVHPRDRTDKVDQGDPFGQPRNYGPAGRKKLISSTAPGTTVRNRRKPAGGATAGF